jgi:MYXO-CTERM domain-containing protein
MRRLATFFESVPSGLFWLDERLFASWTLLLLLGCLACCDGHPPPDCEITIDEQAVPECLEVNPRLDEFGDGCAFHVEVVNECPSAVEMTFFCESEPAPEGHWCHQDQVISAGSNELVPLLRNEDYSRWEAEVPIALDLVDESDATMSNDADEDEELQAAVVLTLFYDGHEPVDSCGVGSMSASPPSLPWLLWGLLVLGGLFRVGRD